MATDTQPRKASREVRRQQLIDATIATLARLGFARTTLTEVAATAGLSHGLIIFHFETKERLLAEALKYMAREYRDNWARAIDSAGLRPSDQLEALVRADFTAEICAPERLAAWNALWAESQSRPIYQEHCAAFDRDYLDTIERLCAELQREGGYLSAASHAARAIRVSLTGLWFDLMTQIYPATRQDSLQTMLNMLAAFYPRHFDHAGARKTILEAG